MSTCKVFFHITAGVVLATIAYGYDWSTNPGTGEPNNPYQISTTEQLLSIHWDPSLPDPNLLNKSYILTGDIDLTGYSFATAVIAADENLASGYQGLGFCGVFDGQHYRIQNLTIDSSGAEQDYLGLFGYLGADSTVCNMGLENVSVISSGGIIGGLCGRNSGGTMTDCFSSGEISGSSYVGGLCGWNWGSILNCHTAGQVTGGSSYYDGESGGLCGGNWEGNITYCSSSCTVSGHIYVGGLCGKNYKGTIAYCHSTNPVSGSERAGGLVGYNHHSTISTSYATGAVSGDSYYLGGLCGLNDMSTISNSYATGSVGGASYYRGGLCGLSESSSIAHCYSLGTVSGLGHVGGFLGDCYGNTPGSCYFLNTAGPDNGYGTPLDDPNMKIQSSFIGWDFVDIWWNDDGVSYPHLWWEIHDQPWLDCAPERLIFSVPEGGANPEGKSFFIRNMGPDPLTWTTESSISCQWLSFHPDEGTLRGIESVQVSVDVDITGLEAGDYECFIVISSPEAANSPQTVTVELEVIGLSLELSETHFLFFAAEGGSNPDPQTLVIGNAGGGLMEWAIEPNAPGEIIPDWLSIDPENGMIAGPNEIEVSLTVDASSLSAGNYEGVFQVSAPGAFNSPQRAYVSLNIGGVFIRVPQDYPTIQDAIDAAVDGSRILVMPGRYYENIDFKGKNIILQSSDPGDIGVVTRTVICGQSTNSTVIFSGSETPSCVLEGLTITRGGWGGIEGNGTHATIRGCYIHHCVTSILDADGLIENCIVAYNISYYSSGGLADCDGTIRNCTIVNNEPCGVEDCNGTITNCILWGNTWSDVYNSSTLTHSCYPGGSGTNIGTNPLFSSSGFFDPDTIPWFFGEDVCISYFTLQSEAGRWDPNTQQWVVDEATSPCIDAGDPADEDWMEELWPHGKRINMGAYGGTPEASMSPNPVGFLSDVDHDDFVGLGDLALFCEDWLVDLPLLDTDLDRDNDVDMDDFSVLSSAWKSGSPPVLSISENEFVFIATESVPNPNNQILMIGNLQGWDLDWNIDANNIPNWLSIDPLSGTLPAEAEAAVTLSVDTSGLSCGLYDYTFHIVDPNAPNSPQIIVVSLLYPEGSGSPENPFQISSAPLLISIGSGPLGLDQSYVLTQDIDLSEYSFSEAVIAPDMSFDDGFQGPAFTGRLDGDGHTISNMTIYYEMNYLGLFGFIGSGGSVFDLEMNNFYICCYSVQYVGGLCGRNEGTITRCHAAGMINGSSNYVGGLCGINEGTITYCYTAGIINESSVSFSVGGLCGDSGNGIISNCHAAGSVRGGIMVGGLCGEYGTIKKSYAISEVEGEYFTGGLVGLTYPGRITSSYFLKKAGPDNGYGEPLTDAEMKQQASFVGWDFVNIWRINEGITYPYLWWE